MSERKAFLLRLDPGLYSALQRWAADDLRSLNGQIEYLLRRTLRDSGRGMPSGGPSSESAPSIPEPSQ